MSEEFPYADKNSERRMLFARCRQIKDVLGGRICCNRKSTGGFLFRDGQSSIDKIDEGEWKEFGANDYWGYREQYCWFKQTVIIPEEYAGKKVAYNVTPYPDSGWYHSTEQFIIFVNGKMVQGLDSNHTFIFLTEKAEGGEKFDIALSAYCDDWEFRGPSRLSASICEYDDDISRVYYDFAALYIAADTFEADDMARVNIVKAMNNAANMLELCTEDRAVLSASARKASEYLHENIFGADNDALISAVGHTHIDTAWKWRLRQTRDKAGRSFATVLNLMKEFPEYRFMSPQAQLYDFVKQDYPAEYEEIKKAVKEGRWEAEGSMWVESDTNVVSGESLVRQFMFGKRFFRDEFGADNKIMWLPDVFGYSGAVPQIIKKADMDYFMTTKISWNEFNRFPYDTFEWEGIDGTKVLAHFEPSTDNDDRDRYDTTYNAEIDPKLAVRSWHRYSNKDLNMNVLCSFGHGDGGGGPTREMLEYARRLEEGIPGCPKVKQEFARDFFDRLKKDVEGSSRLPKWRGELYLEYHRGTLTAQARNKRFNRKSEMAYHDTETLCETAHILKGAKYPANDINENWKLILLNQFHDIIPGSSIFPVYEDSKKQYEKVLADASSMKTSAMKTIVDGIGTDGDTVTVFNTFGLVRTDVAEVEVPFDGDAAVYDNDGKAVPSQRTADGKLIFLAKDIPAKGYKTFKLVKGEKSCFENVKACTKGAENDYYSLKFDENMNISSLYHKESGREVCDGETLGRITAYEDRSHQYEAWDIKCYYDEKFWHIDCVDSAKVVEEGPVRTVVEICRHFMNSPIKQYYIFYNHTTRIDVRYDIDWKERNIAVKTDFPVDVNAEKATFDIQFGNIERSTTTNTLADFAQFESCGHKWADLSDNGFGLSILNDCKYGWSVKDGHIRPTLLRSATDPNYAQDRERHQFVYAVYPHKGNVASSDVVREAYSLNLPFETVYSEAHEGELPAEYSLVKCSADNVIIETVKKAEDSDALIVRLYETWNTKTNCTITFAPEVASVSECNLLEEKDEPVDVENNAVKLTVKPFEIKTLKVKLK